MQTNAALSDLAQRALALADAEKWGVAVQADDGTRAVLMIGKPGRTLVLLLSPEADARPAPPAACPPVMMTPLSPEGV